MPRVALPIETVASGFPLAKETVVWTDADASNGQKFIWTGRELLLAYNSGAGSRSVTFQSVPINGRQDPLHNSAISLAAGELAVFNLRGGGWKQVSGDDSGSVQVSGSHAELKFMVIRTPA